MSKKKTIEKHEEYLKEVFGMDFIAGFTENGVPYGTHKDDNLEGDELDSQDVELPF